MNGEWIPFDGRIKGGEVLRWTESDWRRGRGRRSKPLPVARRMVTAKVMGWERSGFVHLKVLKCEVGESPYALAPKALKPGEVIKRKKTTLARGGTEELVTGEHPEIPKVKSRFLS